MKQHLTAALLIAAIGCTALTGCGDRSMNHHAEVSRAQTTAAPAQTAAPETAQTTQTTRRAVTTDSRHTKTAPAETTDTRSLADKAEQALDSIGDAVTSVLTKATSEVHP